MHILILFLVCSMLTAHKTCFPSNSKKSLLSSAPCASGKGSLNVEYLVLKEKNVCSLLWTVPSLKIPNICLILVIGNMDIRVQILHQFIRIFFCIMNLFGSRQLKIKVKNTDKTELLVFQLPAFASMKEKSE